MELTKKIWLNGSHTRYCKVRLFSCKEDMVTEYRKFSPGQEHYRVEGVHCSHTILNVDSSGRDRLSGQTGTVFLYHAGCGAGVVSHEFMHAVLWAWKHNRRKVKAHPLTIENMEQEEELLYTLTHAVRQFYNWFYSVEKKLMST